MNFEEYTREQYNQKWMTCFVSVSLYNIFNGNVQIIVTFWKKFISNLDGILQIDFHLKSSFDKTKYNFDQSI